MNHHITPPTGTVSARPDGFAFDINQFFAELDRQEVKYTRQPNGSVSFHRQPVYPLRVQFNPVGMWIEHFIQGVWVGGAPTTSMQDLVEELKGS